MKTGVKNGEEIHSYIQFLMTIKAKICFNI